jgi:hypothetical protein
LEGGFVPVDQNCVSVWNVDFFLYSFDHDSLSCLKHASESMGYFILTGRY